MVAQHGDGILRRQPVQQVQGQPVEQRVQVALTAGVVVCGWLVCPISA